MTGNEYQLFLSQPPLYVIRKVQRKSPKEGRSFFRSNRKVSNLYLIFQLFSSSYSDELLLHITRRRLPSAGSHVYTKFTPRNDRSLFGRMSRFWCVYFRF